MRQGYKRGRKNGTVAKLLEEQEERRNSNFGINGHRLGIHDMISAPDSSHIGIQDQWLAPPAAASPLLMNWTNPDPQTLQIRHPDGHVSSPSTFPAGSIKSPMTIGFPALDDIVALDHVRHLISLFFVHVSLAYINDVVLIDRCTRSYQYYIERLSKRI